MLLLKHQHTASEQTLSSSMWQVFPFPVREWRSGGLEGFRNSLKIRSYVVKKPGTDSGMTPYLRHMGLVSGQRRSEGFSLPVWRQSMDVLYLFTGISWMYAVMWVKIILLILPSFLLLFNKPFLGTFNAEESGNTNRSRSCPQGERCFWRKEKWRQAQGVIRQRLNEYQTCREDGGAGKRMLADMSEGFR